MPADIRWKQRFENFQKALRLLEEPYQRDRASLSDLEKEGIVQRFEITFELGWKTLKDYLLFNGVAFEQITPRSVIKQGFAAKVLANGQIWIDMLEQRNLLTHTYDEKLLGGTVDLIATQYLPALKQLQIFLEKATE